MIRVRDHFLAGMPSTPRGTNGPFRLIACHTTEGALGVAGAEGTARFLVDTAGTRSASYHELWAWDGADLHVLRIVPPTHAAHSLAPQPPPGPYEPDAWVRDSLGDVWRDPNMWVYAVSIAGRTSVEGVAYAQNPAFLSHARKRLNSLGIGRLAEHSRFNPRTRSDWGSGLTKAIGGLILPIEDDMDWLSRMTPLTPYIATLDADSRVRNAPSLTSTQSAIVTSREVTVVGEVPGDTHAGSQRWLAYLSTNWGLGVTHESNEVSRKPLGDCDAILLRATTAEAEAAALTAKITAAAAALR